MNSGLLFRKGLLGVVLAASLQAAPIQWTAASGGNDNWYQYVGAGIFNGVSFSTAQSAAAASTHMGMTGYLVTVTSAAEQSFIESFGFVLGFGATGTAFLGATDTAVEGTFRWLGGPEAGQALTYTNWQVGRPANQGNVLQLFINAATAGAPPSFAWIDGGEIALGYVIEYGDGIPDAVNPNPDPNPVPEPSTVVLSAAGLAAAAIRLRVVRRGGRS